MLMPSGCNAASGMHDIKDRRTIACDAYRAIACECYDKCGMHDITDIPTITCDVYGAMHSGCYAASGVHDSKDTYTRLHVMYIGYAFRMLCNIWNA